MSFFIGYTANRQSAQQKIPYQFKVKCALSFFDRNYLTNYIIHHII